MDKGKTICNGVDLYANFEALKSIIGYVAVFALLAGLVLRGINKERGNRNTIF